MIKSSDILYLEPPELNVAERLYVPQIVDGLAVTLKHLFRKKRTTQYPEERVAQRVENYRGVHRLNRDPDGRIACVACYMCETACPAHCIHIDAGESPWSDREKYPIKFELDELRCIYCGMCEEACPVDAIELTTEYDVVGLSRQEMVFDKEKLLEVYDVTVGGKPRKNPKITGYPGTGDRTAEEGA